MRHSAVQWLLTLAIFAHGSVAAADAIAIVDPLSTCSSDGWCRRSPYLPNIKGVQGEQSAWLILDQHLLFRRKAGSMHWTRVQTPDGVLEDIATVPGKDDLWLLAQRRQPCNEKWGCEETLVGRLSDSAWSTQVLRGHLYSIWAAAPDDVWAVGGYGEFDKYRLVIYRWTTGGWRREPLSADWHWMDGPLRKVWGPSTSDVWAVGGPAIFHWGGRRWKQIRYHPLCRKSVPHPSWSPPDEEYDDIFEAKGEIWIVKSDGKGSCALNLDKWRELLDEVPASQAPSRPPVVPQLSLPPALERGKPAVHFGRTISSADGVLSAASGEVWIDAHGTYLHFNGHLWQEFERDAFVSLPNTVEDYSLLRLASPFASILRCAKERWKLRLPDPFYIHEYWTSSDQPLVIVGSGGLLFRLSEENRGKPVKPFKPNTAFEPTLLWASAADDIWIAATPCDTGEESQWSFAKRCPHDLYHFDGTAIVGAGKVTDRPVWFRAIHGSAKDDVWIVGDRGTTAHYDGNRWTSYPSGTRSRLNGVWSVSRSEAWAVGDDGTILQWDGQG
jgi:hypothetical protein